MRVYLDSCVIIYMVEGAPDVRERVQRQLLEPTGLSPIVVFTDLTRLECRVRPKTMSDAATLADYDDFFASPGYINFMLDSQTFDLATDLRARYRIKTPDALHLAAAIRAKCVGFWTSDQRLAAVAAEQGITVVAVNG